MGKLYIVIVLTIALLSFANHPNGTPTGEKPTFTDCRPHIDATIRNLAAKAVKSGEEATEPQSSDYASPKEIKESVSEVQQNIQKHNKHEANEGSAEQKTQIKNENFVSVKQALALKKKQELENKQATQTPKHHSSNTQNTKHNKTKIYHKTVEKSKKPQHSMEKSHHPEEKSKKYDQNIESNRNAKDDKLKKSREENFVNYNKHNNYKEKDSAEYKSEEKKKYSENQDNYKRKDVKDTGKFPQKELKKSTSKSELGIFSQFIAAVFGLSDSERDEKFSKPWTTHQEFIKKSTEKVKAKSKGPGIISRQINKCVSLIFGLPEIGERDSKWAEPWQTHKEFKRLSKEEKKSKHDVKVMPWDRPSIFSFKFMNSFIELIFGKSPKLQRNPIFSQPWKTHKQFLKFTSKKTEVKPKLNHSEPSKGGIINAFISMFFEVPIGNRDMKWQKPWQSHEEFKKDNKKSSPSPKDVKKSIQSGMIGNLCNNAIYSIFGISEIPTRNSKWNEPWQTHKEFTKVPKELAKAHAKRLSSPGVISRAINSAVGFIFGKVSNQRDQKWANAWQTHKEFLWTSKDINKEKDKKSSSDKVIHVQKSVDKPKYVKKDDTEVDKHLEKREHQQSEKEYRNPKTETRPQKPAEEPIFHYSHKDTEPLKYFNADQEYMADIPKSPERPVLEKTKEKRERREKILEYDEQIVVVPSHVRSRDHIKDILGLDEINSQSSSRTEHSAQQFLKELKNIYQDAVSPLEKTYRYQDISNRHLSDAELYGPPVILLLGPYSTGKSTFINYLLGIEFTKSALKTGTPPSHGVFRIIQHGEHDREFDGTDVSGQWLFSSLQKFGQNFVDQIKGKTLNNPLLKKVTFVEAPGVLEMRRPNERLYPFNDVLQWFIDRADLILVMFDHTKLDAGFEMEAILDQLKGRESQTRILLNKADQVPPEELIKVQGSLFWNLSPLLGVNAPPTVYAGSYASFQYRPVSPIKLFEAQEEALLHDIASALNSRVNNRIAIVRRHAVRVRNHAQMVDTYLNTFYKNKGFLTSKHKLADDIIDSPHDYNIYEGLTLHSNVSRYDLPDAEVYRDFFRIHNLYDFPTLRQTCSYIGGCPLERIDSVINKQLPALMNKYRSSMDSAESNTPVSPSFNPDKSNHAGAHARAGKL